MPAEIKQVICVRKDLHMRKGKTAAQVAHAAIMFLTDQIRREETKRKGMIRPAVFRPYESYTIELNQPERSWTLDSFTKVVLGCKDEGELLDLMGTAIAKGIQVYDMIDNGITEFHGELTRTCAAFGPDFSSDLDQVTGHLKPL